MSIIRRKTGHLVLHAIRTLGTLLTAREIDIYALEPHCANESCLEASFNLFTRRNERSLACPVTSEGAVGFRN